MENIGEISDSDPSSPAQKLADGTSDVNEKDLADKDFIRTTLITWNLQEYFDVFMNEKVTKDVLLQMPDDDVQKFIPVYGDRYRFLIQRKQLLDSSKLQEPEGQVDLKGNQLKKLLNSSVRGKCILAEKDLSQYSDELSTIIADHIINTNGRLRGMKSQYLFWRDEITALWPSELLTDWFQPGVKRKASSGKLYNRVNNFASKFNSVYKKLKTDKESQRNNAVQNTAAQYILQLANTSLDDTEKIINLWTKTHEHRKENITTVTDYFERYIQLKTPLVKTLLELDFDLMKVADGNALINRWPKLSQQIIQVANNKGIDIKSFTTAEDVPSDVLAWKLLPMLFRPIAVAVGVKKAWTPSKQEQSDGFITWVSTFDQLDSVVKPQNNICTKYKITRQPFIVAVGSPKTITAYVIIESSNIKCGSVTNAVDFCFKASFALGTKYQTASTQIWTFLEQEVYSQQMTNDSQQNYLSISKLRKALKKVGSNESKTTETEIPPQSPPTTTPAVSLDNEIEK
ncbi:uncharacterized protein LOC123261258 [Cotesia glomerata]|uniref:Uncharacterized protein n=1 Tax=Cotesia glomerata TaxID=32391 RepID=A0AAV7IF84_COTGL|nr:uncharacterized protein LOC123261258 [Cotesia glomerata]KAH0549747.1 hypothetical protein KQX54_013423 [Cotesia glomerata]